MPSAPPLYLPMNSRIALRSLSPLDLALPLRLSPPRHTKTFPRNIPSLSDFTPSS